MRYLKWKLSHDVWGTYPVETIAAMGGKANTSEYVDGDGYRIAYLSEDVDISALDSVWDVTEVTEAQALTFCQQFYEDAVIMANGRVSSRPSTHDKS